MNELGPCTFCGGTKIWIGTIAECEMQDKNHPDYEFNRIDWSDFGEKMDGDWNG